MEVGVVVAVRPVECVRRHVAGAEQAREELERRDDGSPVLRLVGDDLAVVREHLSAVGEERHLEVPDGIRRGRRLGHADAVDLGVLGRVFLAKIVLRPLPERPVFVPLHGDLVGVVRQAGLLQEIPTVVDLDGLDLDRHTVVRALLGLVVPAVGDRQEFLDIARLELVDDVGGLDKLPFPRILGHNLPVVEDVVCDVRASVRREGAEGLVAAVLLDGEGDVEVNVLGLAEVLGDLQHRLVLFLVVAAVPPDGQLLRLGTRHHRESEDAGGSAGADGARLKEVSTGTAHALVSFDLGLSVRNMERVLSHGPSRSKVPLGPALSDRGDAPAASGSGRVRESSPNPGEAHARRVCRSQPSRRTRRRPG